MRTEIHNWVARWQIPPQAAAELFALAGLRSVPAATVLIGERHNEARIGNDTTEAVDRWGGALWRNNSGVAREVDEHSGRPRPVRYGLGNISKQVNAVFKSSDRIGIAPGGRFLAVEVKPTGWIYNPRDQHQVAQANFLNRVNQLGGIGTFATCVADVVRAINQS